MPTCKQPYHWTPEGHTGRGTQCYSGPNHIHTRERQRSTDAGIYLPSVPGTLHPTGWRLREVIAT